MDANRIRIGIAGYGNLGRGTEAAIAQSPDMTLAAVFTRREPASLTPATPGVPVLLLQEAAAHSAQVDVMILCGGSRTDLPEQGPALARHFTTVDSFDTHARIPDHFGAVDAAARQGRHVAVISAGWDPGLFSLNRLYGEAILPVGTSYTFWGKGVSQGHSDALRRVAGVKAAVQYTIPDEAAVERVRSGQMPELTTREKHTRECWVVLEDGADPDAVRREIVAMPDYFSDYDTTVHFVDDATLARDHAGMPHGGFVMRSGTTAEGGTHLIEYSLKLESNPAFTASVLVACARAAHRLHERGEVGARTMFDIPPGLLSPRSAAELRAQLL